MYLLPILGIGILLAIFVTIEKTASAPASLAAWVWLAFTVPGIFVSDLSNYWIGCFAIYVLVISFGIGAIITQLVTSGYRDPSFIPRQLEMKKAFLLIVNIFLAFLSIMAIVVPVWFVGWKELSLEGLLSASRELTNMRYEGEALPWYANVLLSAFYALSIIGGWTWDEPGSLKIINRFFATLGLVCSFVYASITTARATLFFSVILFLGGYFAARALAIRQGRHSALSGLRILAISITTLSFLLATFLFGGLIRASGEDLSFVVGKSDSYFGGIAGLSHWILTSDKIDLTWGTYTLAGIADMVGLKQREIGITQEVFFLPSGNPSNLYTAARWLYEDFGVVGAQIVVITFGALSGFAWAKLKRGSYAAAAMYGVATTIILGSPLSSALAYNSIIVALIVFVTVVWFGYRSSEQPRRRRRSV